MLSASKFETLENQVLEWGDDLICQYCPDWNLQETEPLLHQV